MSDVAQGERERLEIDYWSQSSTESPGADSLDAFTNKMGEARVLLEKLDRFAPLFRDADSILEIGGGQCWVASIIKRQFGAGTMVVGSDIAPDAVASVREWERIFRTRLDGATACRSYEIPVLSASIDLVVVFAAAHHFGAHRRTFLELERILKPGGHVLYLHEPGCRRYLHRLALHRVMAKRPVVSEDVLVYRHLRQLAQHAHLDAEVVFAPTLTYRGPIQTVYYLVLSKLPWLQHILPCSVDLIFTKAAEHGV